MREETFEAIGTHWKISTPETLPDEMHTHLMKRVHARIDEFDKNYSRFRSDSLVSLMARRPGQYTLPRDARPMLDLYKSLYNMTGGLFTPLIGQTLSDAGYDANYSLKTKEVHTPPAWDKVLDYQFPTLTLKAPALLDFGAAGKGYLVDIVSDLLKDVGLDSFVVDAGGDIYAYSKKGEGTRVALEHPLHVGQAIGVATITNNSICGSAGNRRTWGEFHHILNPNTLQSPRELSAVWVVADTALLADALTTALFFVPPELLQEHYAFEYLLMYADQSVLKSPQFPVELFT